MDENQAVNIVYTNYKGSTKVRRIIPKQVRYGSTDYHTEEQWLLVAHDIEKDAERTFAVADIKAWWA